MNHFPRIISLSYFAAMSLIACSEQGGGGITSAVPTGPDASDSFGSKLGTVEFPVSCNAEATPRMERALALLHHMTYSGAELEFSNAVKADPECALAYWGVAMSYVHPLWNDPPSEARLQRGLDLLQQAQAINGKTEREAAWIAAALAYYEGAESRTEPESLVLFKNAWQSVYSEYPEDIEAASFYALALMGAADKSDLTFSDYAQAGAVVEEVLIKVPDHPAGHHYVIHAYDTPPFADQALSVAEQYSNVAPEVPHALHMPTHIFTRLGHWDDSIDMNTRSAVAAEQSTGGEFTSSQMLHAQDYLVYAHLQQANEDAARHVLEGAMKLEGPWDKNARGAAAYALAAMPARYALERQLWSEAAAIEPRTPASFPWSDAFAAFEAIAWFGKGLGAALSGQENVAAEALIELRHLQEVVTSMKDAYWATQIEIQVQTIEAWIAWSGGDMEGGLTRMKQAARLENSTNKHPITPGEILPANELLGDMLMAAGQPEAAIDAYRSSLDRSPNRFNSLYGLAQASEQLGDHEQAAVYFGQVLDLAGDSEADWPRLKIARNYQQGVSGP